MQIEALLGILAIGTLGAVVVFALISKKRTRDRMQDENAPKSRLAEDAPNK